MIMGYMRPRSHEAFSLNNERGAGWGAGGNRSHYPYFLCVCFSILARRSLRAPTHHSSSGAAYPLHELVEHEADIFISCGLTSGRSDSTNTLPLKLRTRIASPCMPDYCRLQLASVSFSSTSISLSFLILLNRSTSSQTDSSSFSTDPLSS